MKKLILIAMLIAGCTASKPQLCPSENSIHYLPGAGLVITPKDFFNWKTEDGQKYWMPYEKYIHEYELNQRKGGGF